MRAPPGSSACGGINLSKRETDRQIYRKCEEEIERCGEVIERGEGGEGEEVEEEEEERRTLWELQVWSFLLQSSLRFTHTHTERGEI